MLVRQMAHVNGIAIELQNNLHSEQKLKRMGWLVNYFAYRSQICRHD